MKQPKTRAPRQSKVRNECSIVDGVLYFEDVRQCAMSDEMFTEMIADRTMTALRVVSLAHNWEQRVWLNFDQSLIEKLNVEMTLRKERRGEHDHWYAYRRVHGTLHKRYVGYSEDITEAKLLSVSQKMPSR